MSLATLAGGVVDGAFIGRKGGETQLWHPVGPLQGGLARIAEEVRQVATDDQNFTGQHPYCLELVSTDEYTSKGSAVFVLPVAPENISLTRHYRTQTTATMGGIVVANQGYAHFDLEVSGHFGLAPKYGHDSTQDKDLADIQPSISGWGSIGGLSGPKWTARMIQHFFDKYALAKYDPKAAHKTHLIWHNFRDNEHFAVVPVRVDVRRSQNQRMLYPYNLTFTVVGDAESITKPMIEMGLMSAVLGGLTDVIGIANTVASVISGAGQTLSAYNNVLKNIIQRADGVLMTLQEAGVAWGEDLESSSEARNKALEGFGARLGIKSGYSALTAELEEAKEEVAEKLGGDPNAGATAADAGSGYGEVLSAIGAAIDGLDAALANPDLKQDDMPYDEAAKEYATNFSAYPDIHSAIIAAGADPTIPMLPDIAGAKPVEVTSTTTLQGLAETYLEDPALWKVIALMNGLKAPYISIGGLPGSVGLGDFLLVPVAKSLSSKFLVGKGSTPKKLYGVDALLRETTNSMPGRPQVDLVIDNRTGTDIKTVQGFGNLRQAVQMRVWTDQGSMSLFPSYGWPAIIGVNIPSIHPAALRLSYKRCLARELRIKRILSMRAAITNDVLDIEATVLPVGATNGIDMTTSVT